LMLHVDADGQMVANCRRKNIIVKETGISLSYNGDALTAGNG
jgi:hypothetical protein